LLDGGVHEYLANREGKTAMDIAETDEACRILSVKRTASLRGLTLGPVIRKQTF